MTVAQRDVPDWMRVVSRSALGVPGFPVTLGASATVPVTFTVDATLHTLILMFRNVVGTVGYSVVGTVTGFTYDGNTNIGSDRIERVGIMAMIDTAITVTITTGAASGVTVYAGVTADPEYLSAAATIVNASVPVSGSVGLNAGTNTIGSIGNTQIPTAANMTNLGTITVAAGSTGTQNYNLPSFTTAIYVLTNQAVNSYSLAIYAGIGTAGQQLYGETSGPRTQLQGYPCISGTSPVTLSVVNNLTVSSTYTFYAVVGALPTITDPMGSFMRVQPNIWGTGYADYVNIPTSGSGTVTRWQVIVPTGLILVLDNAHIQMAAFATPGGSEAQILLLNNASAEIGRIAHLTAKTTPDEQVIPGPAYLGPGNSIIGQTSNVAGSTAAAMGVSAAYHYIVQ